MQWTGCLSRQLAEVDRQPEHEGAMEGQKYLAPLQTTSGTAWQPPAGGVPPVVTPLESLSADDNSATDDTSANGRASPSGSLPGSVVSTQVNGNSLKERRPDLVKVRQQCHACFDTSSTLPSPRPPRARLLRLVCFFGYSVTCLSSPR